MLFSIGNRLESSKRQNQSILNRILNVGSKLNTNNILIGEETVCSE